MASPSLDEMFDPRRNSLNAIRLALATLVIVYHAWPIGDFGAPPRLGGMEIGPWAVAGFFAISGWLITGSRLSTGLPVYLGRRLLRIWPGMFACLLVIAFGLAPIAAAIGPGTWRGGEGIGFVARNSFVWAGEYEIGDTLATHPTPHWNGTMWTLAHEFACYLLIGLLVSVVPRRHLTHACTLWLGTGTLILAAIRLQAVEIPSTPGSFVRMSTFFAAGAWLYLQKGNVRVSRSVVLLAVAALAVGVAVDAPAVVAPLPVAYLCLWLGLKLGLHRIGRRNDLSYGIYIYGLPVGQILICLDAQRLGLVPLAGLNVLATVPFAALSWFAVERPALRLKHRRRRPPRRIDLTGQRARAVRNAARSGSSSATEPSPFRWL